jgi:hypothetical protein
VPLLPDNACYRWYIRHDATDTAEVPVVETLRLAEPFPGWIGYDNDPSADMQISADGIEAVSKLRLVSQNGWISNGWCVVDGDPTGPYSVSAVVDGGKPVVFEFTVVAPEDYAFAEPEVAPEPETPPPPPFNQSPFSRTTGDSW